MMVPSGNLMGYSSVLLRAYLNELGVPLRLFDSWSPNSDRLNEECFLFRLEIFEVAPIMSGFLVRGRALKRLVDHVEDLEFAETDISGSCVVGVYEHR